MSSIRTTSTTRLVMGAAILAGALIALQVRMSGELSISMHNAVEVGIVNYISALAILVVIVVLSRSLRGAVADVPAALRTGRIKWWQVLGGIFGGIYIALQASTTPLIGVAVFVIAITAGRVANALIVDRLGIGRAEKESITWQRVLGGVLMIIAVVIAVAPDLHGGAMEVAPVILAFVAGMLVPVQASLAGRVSALSGQPLSAAFYNFLLGSIVLGVVLGVSLVVTHAEVGALTAGPWWAYFGGVIGIVYVAVAAWSVVRIGVLLFALLNISGMLIGALLVDVIAPVAGTTVSVELVLGIVVAFVAVAVASYRRTA
jgi:transporter family-2 protein